MNVDFNYGNSYEFPVQFPSSHGLTAKNSYKNPHLFINKNQDMEYAKAVQLQNPKCNILNFKTLWEFKKGSNQE